MLVLNAHCAVLQMMCFSAIVVSVLICEKWLIASPSWQKVISLNPLHLNISMHILHTVLYTFPKMLTRRICVTIIMTLTCGSQVIM